VVGLAGLADAKVVVGALEGEVVNVVDLAEVDADLGVE